jgi:solute:Na+ symporter, SSS family
VISLSLLDDLVIFLYFAGVLAIGFFWSRKKRSGQAAEFLLAGRSLTLPTFVMTLVSTWYGGILGVGEFSYRFGISNWVVQGVPYYIFAAVFAFLLAKRIRATQLMTIPDKLEESYGTPTALLGGFLTFLLVTPAPYILMLAILLEMVTGWSTLLCLIVGTIATTAYLLTGGFRSDVQTDIFEFFLMFLGFAVIIPFAVNEFGGFSYLSANLPPLHLTWHGGNSLQFIVVWFFIALWTLVDPSFHQRCYAAASGEVAQKGILVSIVFWLLFDMLTATAGLYARAALPDLANPVMAYPMLAEKILPAGVKGLFYVGMLAAIMSTLNTLAFVGGTTLGRDVVWRVWKTRGRRPKAKGQGPKVESERAKYDERNDMWETRWTQIGLVVTTVLSVFVAVAIPSVIKLWYTIGTVIVPGLLVPLVFSYFPRLHLSGRVAFVTMLAAWLVSLGWLLAGWRQELGATEYYPFGIEPMFVGIGVSLVIWGCGMILRKKLPENGEILSS